MVGFLMLYSLGMHIMLPLSAGIGMSLSDPSQYGARLGKYNAWGLYATLLSYAFVWLGFRYFHLSYRVSFVIASVFYLLAAFTALRMTPSKPYHKKVKLIFRKKYTLYYILSVVNGARKQIFLTFAPWVLIKLFGVTAPEFAVLGFVIALLSIFTRKFVGEAIDRLGERTVLSAEAVLLILLCMGYSFSGRILPAGAAMVVIAGCYVLDNSMSVVEMARSTYMRKIAVEPGDVTQTLSAGTSLDHIVSMSVPFLGGILWAAAGYQAVFLVAAGIAVTNLILSRFIPRSVPTAAE
jgi:predicted MFS family arabinose efflux permease